MTMTDRATSLVYPTKGASGGPRSRLLSIGTALPDEVLTNEYFETIMDTDDEWIHSRTGIRERRRGSTTTQLATDAGRVAIDRSGLDPELIDLVIVATQTPDDLCPSTAAGVQHALGLRCGAFDLNAACAGFGYGIVTAHSLLATTARAVLVVGVGPNDGGDELRRPLDGHPVRRCCGRGGRCLRRAGRGERTRLPPRRAGMGLRHRRQSSDILSSPIKNGRITGVEMNGKQVFKHMVRYAEDSARSALDRAGLTLDDVSAVLAHQANQRILDTVGRSARGRPRQVHVGHRTHRQHLGSFGAARTEPRR